MQVTESGLTAQCTCNSEPEAEDQEERRFGFIPLCSRRQESGGSCHAASFQLASLGLFLIFK